MNEFSDKTPNSEESQKRSFENFREAIDAGKMEGAAQASEAIPDFKSGVSDAMHDLAYGIAYGSVFAGSFLNELIPSQIREGFSKGASAGKSAGKASFEKAQSALKPDSESESDDHSPNPSFS